ncbi:unnamed protein product [Schistosoma mattheei]|uniref:Uncharacterized protein n=1 Tax=Schistosoma mattheei TaxID=31246 RepID=A0A183P800_9TREM|nr:unnamed protein product [Schistosoma mattheei]
MNTTSLSERKYGIEWTAWNQLDDLDISGDLALTSHSQQRMLMEANNVTETSAWNYYIYHQEDTSTYKQFSTSVFPVVVILPTIGELRMTIRQMRSGKAVRPDNIPAEALNSDTEATENMLHVNSRSFWRGTSVDGLDRRISHEDTKEM